MAAFPMHLLISGPRERLLDIVECKLSDTVEPRYTDSWTAFRLWSEMLMAVTQCLDPSSASF